MSLETLLINRLLNVSFLLIIDITAIWLTFWVYFANPKKLVNRLFGLLSLFILTWVNAAYFFVSSSSLGQAIFWAKAGIGGVFPFLSFFYLFSTHFFSEEKRTTFLDKTFLGLGFFLSFLTFFTSLIVKGAEFTDWGANIIFTSYGRLIFYGVVILFTILAISQLFKNYFQFPKEQKIKIQYFLIGFFVFILFNLIFNVALPLFQKTIKYWQFGNYSAIIFLGFTAYAIVKRRLFGVKVVLTELLVGAMGVILLVLPFLMPSSGLRMLTGAVLALFLIFSYLLIKYTYAQEKRRERAEEIANKERELRKKTEKVAQELKHLNDIRNQMFLTGQHHTRTPLSNIKNFASVLLGGGFGPINKEQKRALEVIMAKVNESIELANLYLSVSQLEAGRGYLKKEKTDFVQLIKEQIEKLKLDAQTKGVKIITDFEKDLPEIEIDKTQLAPCIYAIIDNAIKYCPRKTGKIEVSLKKADRHTFLFSCKDNGIGIKKEDLGYIGKYAYQRTDEARKAHGTGKGLALYYTNLVVQEHKGKFWVESEGQDKGAVFYIELPIK